MESQRPLFGGLSRWAGVFLVASLGVGVWAGDSLYLELSARGEKTDIGLAPVRSSFDRAGSADIAETLKNDLLATGLFSVIEGGPSSDARGALGEWSRLGADVVSLGAVEKSVLGKVYFSVELKDAGGGQTLLARKFPMSEGARRAAHLWADEVVRYFTGQPGVASTHIVFVNDASGKKEVYRVDADGANAVRLTNDRSIALFPKLSPDGGEIVFMSFRGGRPALERMKSDGTNRAVVCQRDGLNSAAAWMPDGRSIVATMSDGRSPNLYQVDLGGRVLQTLTQSAAVDTAPTVSPDGQRLAFTSDRSGPPQIFLMDMAGTHIRRAVAGPQADSPHWSPLGHLIVFTQLEKRYFDLWTLEVATGKTSRLTFGEGDNENASWSPDGRHLVFSSTRGGRPELWVMGADGSQPRRLGSLPGRSFTPHWGL